jgi:hypothetical protein
MASLDLSDVFKTVQVLKTTLSTKTKQILAQIGSVVGEGLTEQDNIVLWQWFGFAARPAKATKGKDAAELFVVRSGADECAIAGRDVRDLPVYGALADGETVVYATGEDGLGQARSFYKKTGTITHYTRKGNVESGAGMMMQLDAVGGGINIVDSFGNAIVSDADGWKFTTAGGAAALVLNADGSIKLIGTAKTQVDGASIVLGSTVVPVVKAALTGPTGIAGVASLKTLIE